MEAVRCMAVVTAAHVMQSADFLRPRFQDQ